MFIAKLRLWDKIVQPNNLLKVFRFVILLISSVSFLTGSGSFPSPQQFLLVALLLLSAFLLNKFYYDESRSAGSKKAVLILEAIGLAILLINSGGMESPFFWYFIIPALQSAFLPPVFFCWYVSAGFIFFLFLLQANLLVVSKGALQSRSEFILSITVFVFLVFGIQYYNMLAERFSRKDERAKERLELIKSFSRSIDVSSQQNEPREIIGLFAAFGRTLTGAQKIIVWLDGNQGHLFPIKRCFAVRGPRKVLPEHKWLLCLQQFLQEKQNCERIFYLPVHENPPGIVLAVKIKTDTNIFGSLFAFFTDEKDDRENVEQSLCLVADLCAIALEKYCLEKHIRETALLKEKERIAGELHDGVTQSLFSLIYGMEALLKQKGLDEYTKKQLRLLQKTARTSYQDLRNIIYGLSSCKNGHSFLELIKEYLSDMGQLNHILISFDAGGSFEGISIPLQNAIYRFIREATGNAVRHAGCGSIEVTLQAFPDKIKVSVKDNGCGFSFRESREKEKRGMGLDNMRELARNQGGIFLLESSPGKGTRVSCEMPRHMNAVLLSVEEEKIGENCCY